MTTNQRGQAQLAWGASAKPGLQFQTQHIAGFGRRFRTPPLNFLVAVAFWAAGLLAHLSSGDILHHSIFLVFIPAVLLSAAVAGAAAGIVAAILCGLSATYFFTESLGTFGAPTVGGWVNIATYAVVCAIMILLVAAMHLTFEKLALVSLDRQRIVESLEQRVEERTAELREKAAHLEKEAQLRELAEAQLRQSQKMEAIGQLAGGVAHDFNNALSIIIGNLDFVLRRLSDGHADVVAQVNSARDGALRAAQLTSRLLGFSRRQPLSPKTTNVGSLMQGMQEVLRSAVGESIETEFTVTGGLWPIYVDRGQLENAVLNVALNARDAMPGGGKLSIEMRNTVLDGASAANYQDLDPGQYVSITISDTGLGMRREVLERAFDPFFTTKEIGKGTGLGLSQVYGFVKQSGGLATISSQVDVGTKIQIYLPRTFNLGEAESPQAAVHSLAPVGAAVETILVVEDNDEVRDTSVQSLRSLGYSVLDASDGDSALRLLSERRVNLLFTDVIMPGMSGCEVVSLALQQQPDLKILYTSGFAQDAILIDGVVDPRVVLLAKPFTIDQLAHKVRAVLDGADHRPNTSIH